MADVSPPPLPVTLNQAGLGVEISDVSEIEPGNWVEIGSLTGLAYKLPSARVPGNRIDKAERDSGATEGGG